MKSIVVDVVCASSQNISRQQIVFDQSGLIIESGQLGIPSSQVDFFFNDDCVAFAGFGDIHIHAREDLSRQHVYKEDFLSASEAALNGGVVHVCDMPNNPIPPIDKESYLAKLHLTEKAKIPFLLYAGIGPLTHPLPMSVPYKAYMGPSVGDLFFKDQQELEDTLARYKNQWVSFHCEDPDVMRAHEKEKEHFQKRPVEAEVVATEVALRLIEKFHLKGKLCHFSSGEGLKKIREARAKKIIVTTEVTPQHLFYSYDELAQKDWTYFQMNPPLRTKYDREEMLQALLKGEVDYLATDHAPHSHQEKSQGHSGLTGLDTYGAFVTWLYHQGFSLERLAQVTSEGPATFVNPFIQSLKSYFSPYQKLGLGFGQFKRGYSASFSILNLKKPLTVNESFLKTKVAHSPFLGVTFPGQVEAVFSQGKKVC